MFSRLDEAYFSGELRIGKINGWDCRKTCGFEAA